MTISALVPQQHWPVELYAGVYAFGGENGAPRKYGCGTFAGNCYDLFGGGRDHTSGMPLH